MYTPQFIIAALLVAGAALTGASPLETRQSSSACNAARAAIVKDISSTSKAVAKIQDPAVKSAAAAGIKTANSGIATIAKSLISGGAPPAAARNTVEAGLNATSTALAGGNSTDPAVASASASLAKAVTAGQAVVADCAA